MPVSQLRESAQLSHNNLIQFGTTDEPCVVLFGLGEIDKDKAWRTIKIVPNDNDLKLLLAFDATHDDLQDIVKEHGGTNYVVVKVNDSRTKSFDALKEKAKLTDVATKDTQIVVIIRSSNWSMNGQHGRTLQAVLVQAVDDNVDINDLL